MTTPKIAHVRAFTVGADGGADYHDQQGYHWIDDHIATPMSRYPGYEESRRLEAALVALATGSFAFASHLKAFGCLEIALLFFDAFLFSGCRLFQRLRAANFSFVRLAFEDVLDVGDLARLISDKLLLDHQQVTDSNWFDRTVGGG